MPELPEIGSRWYIWGRHYEVSSYTTKDGEPAIRMREKGAKRPERFPVLLRSFSSRAVPSGSWD